MARKRKKKKIPKPNPMKSDLRTPKYKKRVVPTKDTKLAPDVKEWD